MRRIWSGITGFLFPGPGTPLWRRALPYTILGIITLAAGVGIVEGWTYTNSPEFCGMACHTMPPEYSAYQRSPHARVQCVECHLGRDKISTQFTRKAGDLRHVTKTLTEDYEYPIRAHEMRPARDSCEQCHFPEKFSDDSLREIRNYLSDENNTEQSTYLIMKTGGGSEREGLGRGIHWHIENEVWFLASDELQQEIPYVRTIDSEGNIEEYYDVASGVMPDDVAGTNLERMDCITCHNRITHSIPRPDEAVDLALSKGLMSTEIPAIRQKSLELLTRDYADQAEASTAFDSLMDFYSENYPETAAALSPEIEEAASTLKRIYGEIVFPDQKLDWETHPDNLGHRDDPGCFRCHDGKHLTGTGEAVRLECNLCHSIPVQVDPATLVTQIEVAQGPEPPSHTHSSWIALHGSMIDSSCAACHAPNDREIDYQQLEGKPPADGSFCGNAACHGAEWQFAGFDAPALEPYLERQIFTLRNSSPYLLEGAERTYGGTFEALLDGRCVLCHGEPEYKADLDLSTYEGILRGGKDGPVIMPGDADNSLMILRQSEELEHPGQVLDQELEALREWIDAGAPQ